MLSTMPCARAGVPTARTASAPASPSTARRQVARAPIGPPRAVATILNPGGAGRTAGDQPPSYVTVAGTGDGSPWPYGGGWSPSCASPAHTAGGLALGTTTPPGHCGVPGAEPLRMGAHEGATAADHRFESGVGPRSSAVRPLPRRERGGIVRECAICH